ncbi:hypothetical protein HK100_003327 [Physocladia obscura]|uniref:Uncharacterized protein n=1 Tax=Physocladia obscura TaxID=109957 RepID=A0AAD5SVT6_9FUNG|nr:hypothetical protein HK100_003327 [Physocladia obscura]
MNEYMQSVMGNVNPGSDDGIVDWKYDMRREIQLIVPNLFLGPYAAARDKNVLATHKITHLVCCLDAAESRVMRIVHPEFQYHFIHVTDSLSENLIPHFPSARAFLHNALSTPGNRVLVYCNNGMSRSPCFVVAYLMEELGWDFVSAFGFVQNRRFCISPNDNFKMQLKEYQPIYQARLAQNQQQQQQHQQHQKRRQHVEDDELADHYEANRDGFGGEPDVGSAEYNSLRQEQFRHQQQQQFEQHNRLLHPIPQHRQQQLQQQQQQQQQQSNDGGGGEFVGFTGSAAAVGADVDMD